MNTIGATGPWRRRARPLLGTLVEVGLRDGEAAGDGEGAARAAFEAIAHVQARMSRFDPDSDVSRFHTLAVGEAIAVDPATAEVLHAARWLHDATDGVFDVGLGSGARGWRCDGERLERLAPVATLDLGGIAKGYAVDVAVEALRRHGCESGWVNAGGDLRVFGDARVPVMLRDEAHGGVRPFATVADAALASSHFGPQSRSRAWGLDRGARACCVSVAAPRCVWADALTKVVAVGGDARHRALGACGAHAWLH
ncbi:MAG: FAD:protein FMN transferase [Steroidobacteraceae bacterium]|nr:FAD:protein FMN transferase [Steroidobacteraceae bacterium]